MARYVVVILGGGPACYAGGMLFLSDFADLGLVLPLAGLVALTLAVLGRRREALAWSLAIAGTFGTIAVLKVLLFLVFGPQAWDGLNPSGHTAAGVLVYGGLLALVAGRRVPRLPLALLGGLVSGLLIGTSRIGLGVHSPADVLVGIAVGLGGVLAVVRLAGPRPVETRRAGLPVVAVVALVAVLTFHGHRMIAETELRAIAAHIQSVGSRAFD